MKAIFTLVAILLGSSCLYAQKDAPVAGHAATLVDLLKKDYNAIELGSRDEEISRDRTLVISIFKSYLTDNQLVKIESDTANKTFRESSVSLQKSFSTYTRTQKRLASYSSDAISLNSDTQIKAIAKEADSIQEDLDTNKKNYFKLHYKVDEIHLQLIKAQFVENKFIHRMINLFIAKYKALSNSGVDRFATANASSSIQKSIPFIGGELAFETVIDGLSRFMAQRIKEELTTYVIGRVKEWLENPGPQDPFAELKVLLPRTSGYLIGFKADKITHFPNEIKQYIEDDLNHVLDNAANLRNTPRVQKLVKSYPDVDFALEALELVPSLSKVKRPVDYFTFLENSGNISRWAQDPDPTKSDSTKTNIANAIYFTSLLSRSLVVHDNGELRFAGVDFINAYAAENNFFLLYAGFLQQQNLKYYKISFKREKLDLDLNKLLQRLDTNNVDTLEANKKVFMAALTMASKNGEKIFTTATEIRKANKAGKKVGIDSVYTFIKSVIDYSQDITTAGDMVLTHIADLNHTRGKSFPSLKKMTAPYFSVAHTTNNVIYDIQKKNYATALIKMLEISSGLVQDDHFSKITALARHFTDLSIAEPAAYWAKFTSALINSDTGKDLKAPVTLAAAELQKISYFYQNNYPETPLLHGIQTLNNICFTVLQNKEPTKEDIEAARKLINDNPEFQRLIVSYYANFALEPAMAKLNNELSHIYVPGVNNRLIQLFGPIETKQLRELFDTYSLAVYNYYFKNKEDDFLYIINKRTEKKELAEKRQLIAGFIAGYVAVIPQKFEVQLNPQVISLIHFVNDMAVAEDAGDVEQAIEAFALPAGSFAIKRNSKNNFSLNSYPGILFSNERVYKAEGHADAFSLGFTAPIGVSYSLGTKKGHSWGLFVPVFDIGAVTRLRLDDSNATKALPEFNFKNLLSPGLYISYGFPKTPFSINGGAQFGPELKEIVGNNAAFYESWRFGAGIVLDIPLFNLHTRPW